MLSILIMYNKIFRQLIWLRFNGKFMSTLLWNIQAQNVINLLNYTLKKINKKTNK